MATSDEGRDGFRCVWTNVRDGSHKLGSWWPDRRTANAMARMLRRSLLVTDVEVVPSSDRWGEASRGH